MRIAVLGAGNVGVGTCLELASAGHSVDLYDENARPVSRASFHNEGKIHLGLLYANDPSFRTASLMLEGALRFAPLLDRWVGFDADELLVSTPFHYAVHRGSQLSVDELTAHFARCRDRFEEVAENTRGHYLGRRGPLRFRLLSSAQSDDLLEMEHYEAVFETSELGIDPRRVAVRLRAAVEAEPRIRFVGGTTVCDVRRRRGSGFEIDLDRDGATFVERYDQVVNSLWHGRLEIDGRLGLRPDRPFLYRYKLANRILVPLEADELPSVTGVLGPFGDLVNYGEGGLFLSWHPTGMIATSTDVRPPDWHRELTPKERYRVFRQSFEAWLERCPRLRDLRFEPEDVDPGGGVIFTWGDTDIDDPHSLLHTRYQIGVHSEDGFHTVNTGKLTMSLYLGLLTARRVLGVG